MKQGMVFALSIVVIFACSSRPSPGKVRISALAGRWYPSHSGELAATVDRLFKEAPGKKSAIPLMLILPHAGYPYSGKTAAAGYRCLSTVNPDIIVIMGPSHHGYFRGCSVLRVDFYETPLGRVRVDRELAEKVLLSNHFKTEEEAHRKEHSIEIQLPLLQRIYGKRLGSEIPILPILVGAIDSAEAEEIAVVLAGALRSRHRPLVIISSDFTHYGPSFGYVPFRGEGLELRRKVKALDDGAIEYILKHDREGFSRYCSRTGVTICGQRPIMIALSLPVKNYRAELIHYDTSGSVTGDYENAVSYAAIAVSGTLAPAAGSGVPAPFSLSRDDRIFLLSIARRNIEAALKGRRITVDPGTVPAMCRRSCGVFVTLKKKGELRGCIGYITGIKPLYEGVVDNSYNAAFRDPRFSSLLADELKDISIEISVLTEPEQVQRADEIMTGRDGLIIEQGRNRGLLLPQVAKEQGWDRDRFLAETCRKAGLSPDAWRSAGTRIYRFQAIVFREDAPE